MTSIALQTRLEMRTEPFVLPAFLVIAALGFINYLLWGRSMMQATAGEREEAELKAREELEPWNLPEPRRPRHL